MTSMSAVQNCITGIQARDFLSPSASFFLPTGLTSVDFYLMFPDACVNGGFQANDPELPAEVTIFPTNDPTATPVVCDPLTYDTLTPYYTRYTYLSCPLNTYTVNSGSQYTLKISSATGDVSTSFLTTIFIKSPQDACTDIVAVDGAYLSTVGQNLSPTDTGGLTFYVSYTPLDCSQIDSGVIPVTITDPSGKVYSSNLQVTTNTAGTSPTYLLTAALSSTSDFGLPANGQLEDGIYTITAFEHSATFTVSHQLNSPSGFAVRRRTMASRWNEYVNQVAAGPKEGGDVFGKDSSFYFKAPMNSCKHTQCPVQGQVGVFECVDIQTDLDSCGGCPSQGGKACGDIAGVTEVGCVAGKCIVSSCDDGWQVAGDKSECVPLAPADAGVN